MQETLILAAYGVALLIALLFSSGLRATHIKEVESSKKPRNQDLGATKNHLFAQIVFDTDSVKPRLLA